VDSCVLVNRRIARDITNGRADKPQADNGHQSQMYLSRAFVLGIMLSAPPVARGQDSVAITLGARARVYAAPSGISRTGFVERVTADTLFLGACRGCKAEAVPRDAVQRVDVSIGRGGYPGRGVAIGVLAGTAFGVFVIGRCDTRDDALWVGCGYGHFVGGLAGAFAGMLIGGVLGRWWPQERWRPARLPWPVTPGGGLTNVSWLTNFLSAHY
jgi:hypothetical protein